MTFLGLFDAFRRHEQPPEAIAEAERVLSDCNRLPGLQFNHCIHPRGHAGMCHFEPNQSAPVVTVRRPESDTLQRRRQMVSTIANWLRTNEHARSAWGTMGDGQRRKLASHILDLLWRNEGQDGGLALPGRLP